MLSMLDSFRKENMKKNIESMKCHYKNDKLIIKYR